MTGKSDINTLLLQLDGGGKDAVDLLFERLHGELRAIAARVEEARTSLGPQDAGIRLAELRLVEFEGLMQEG